MAIEPPDDRPADPAPAQPGDAAPTDSLEPPDPASGPFRAHPLERLGSLVLALGFAGIWAAALSLTPDPSGIGTHTQVGLPPCGLYEHFGIPCLSCGWTTAFANMARLRGAAAARASPFGALLFLAGFAAAAGNLAAAATGRSFFRVLARLDWTWIGVAAVALMLVSWAYKFFTVS